MKAETSGKVKVGVWGRFCKDLGEKEVNDERRIDNVL